MISITVSNRPWSVIPKNRGYKKPHMFSQDHFRVCTASSLEEADLIVAWLASNGVDARIKDRNMVATFTWGTLAIAPIGVEIVVGDQESAGCAAKLLAERERQVAASRGEVDKTVEAQCEECGSLSTWPARSGSRVEQCPRCRAYLDVPRASD